jgi:hypothetical protein
MPELTQGIWINKAIINVFNTIDEANTCYKYKGHLKSTHTYTPIDEELNFEWKKNV